MNLYQIPLTNEPNQTFRCFVPIDGKNRTFTFCFSFNPIAGYWEMIVKDGDSEECLASCIPLITGEYPSANLLEQYSHLDIGSAVIVPAGALKGNAEPDADTLGAEFYLVWSDTL